MANRRRRRIWVLPVGALTLAVVASSPVWGMKVARSMSWLEIRQVEISGTRLIPPHEVLSTSGIVAGQHLLDDPEEWIASLTAHPVIRTVRLERRLPGTLRIRIDERVPVALLNDGSLRFATADGVLLPVEPFSVPLDLPIVIGSLSDSASAARTTRILQEAERLAGVDPVLLREVSEIAAAPNDPQSLVLQHPNAEIVVPFGVSAVRLTQLRRVLADVERRYATPPEAGARGRHRIDLRFSDQVVVRPSPPREHS